MNINEDLNTVVELYFQGYTVEEALRLVDGEIEKEVLNEILKNYERRMKYA